MGFLASAIARKSPVSTLELFREIYGSRISSAGKTVNLQTAIAQSTCFSCARLLGNGNAQVPLKLLKTTGRKRVPATDHPLYDVLAVQPNPWQTSFEFRQVQAWHVELAGRFIAFKNAPLGVVRELIPFQPSEVRVVRNDDLSLTYEVTSAQTGKMRLFPAEAIWHVRGPSWNSWDGIDWLQAARDAIGLAIALEESAGALHRNGVRTTGAWSVEGKLKEEQFKQLREWIEREHAGAAATGKPMIIDQNGKWMPTTMTALDAQHREMRAQQIEEVCRFFGVLPIMVGYSDKATTYASAEQMMIAHLVHTLAPRWRMYEDSLNLNLLTEKERADGYYFKYVAEGMIRGSVKDTIDAILKQVNGGLITVNEGRELLDRNPSDDPKDDELRMPVNVAQESQQPADPASNPKE